MDQLRLAYQSYKDSEYSPLLKTPYLEIKRLFRCRKRYNIQMKRDKNLKQLDDLFQYDRETFWKKIKDAQRIKQEIDMPLNTASSEYKDLFNTPFDSKVDKQKIKKELDEMLAEPELPEDKIIVDQETVEIIIKELKNGKSTGYHGISNEMVKYAINKTNKRMAKCDTTIFNKLIESSQVRDNFNVSIVKPMIKDDKKPSNNKSNLRPVAVSDVSDVCFEKTVAKVFLI